MKQLDEIEHEIDAGLAELESTLDEYEQTLAEIEETLSDTGLDDTRSVDRYSADSDGTPVSAE